MWDPENPLDLNKPITGDHAMFDALFDSDTRAFEPAFSMDLNDLVQSLWIPKRRPSSSTRGHRKEPQRVSASPTTRRERFGSPPPPQPSLPTHAVPPSVRDDRYRIPSQGGSRSLDDYESRPGRAGRPAPASRVSYDMDLRLRRRDGLSRERGQWVDEDDEVRARRSVDKSSPPSRRDTMEQPPTLRQFNEYSPVQYDQPSTHRTYDDYAGASNGSAGRGHFSDDEGRRTSQRRDPHLAGYLSEAELSSRREEPRYASQEPTALRREEEVERQTFVARTRSDHQIDLRSEPRSSRPIEPRNGQRDDGFRSQVSDRGLRRMASEPISLDHASRRDAPLSDRGRHRLNRTADEPHIVVSSRHGARYLSDKPSGGGSGFLSAHPTPQAYQAPPPSSRQGRTAAGGRTEARSPGARRERRREDDEDRGLEF